MKSLGVQQLVIVVNKMDEPTVKWSQERFDEIKTNLTPFLTETGFTESNLHWIPISGLVGSNIADRSDACSWYNGPCLMEVLDGLPVEARNPDGPLRFPILDKMRDSNKTIAMGKVEQGTLKLGDKLAISPSGLPCQVLEIENFSDEQVTYARPGDAVKVKISNLSEDQVNKGDCMCPRDT